MEQFVRNQKLVSDLRTTYERNLISVKEEHEIALKSLREALNEKENQVSIKLFVYLFLKNIYVSLDRKAEGGG